MMMLASGMDAMSVQPIRLTMRLASIREKPREKPREQLWEKPWQKPRSVRRDGRRIRRRLVQLALHVRRAGVVLHNEPLVSPDDTGAAEPEVSKAA